jgi:hypothetical protein
MSNLRQRRSVSEPQRYGGKAEAKEHELGKPKDEKLFIDFPALVANVTRMVCEK